MHPENFLTQLRQARASAILRTSDDQAARNAMDAAVRAGFRIIEFTMTVPGVLDLIRDYSRKEGLLVGAGTVLTIEQARSAVEAGACYLVSPVVDPDIIQEAGALGVAVMPGCSTPTEMLLAHRQGAQLQKLFPAPGIGPAMVQQILGPLPFLKIVPTSGVTLENVAEYLEAGAFAVGFVKSLFEPEDIAAGRFDVIENRAREMLRAAAVAP
ncbi:MAG: bifunctional 4-hydroxy-2-oxoglutarate aldolase/2-dehydro-3-deoxy-phosphogluconate aldolase [Roseibacillus sp.]|jgi:Entner-Doudoroff aldolase|nr:bifunctional 4-hydroxy-2-oxoglutarate aldolase/2-dehydro-3-deoxy-phosphogluconate aldolase [Actinomycetales bacterium]MCP4895121.1 bifunctional 4-hydroxy-2-oxoglutarate aldolase/2-dehydro-3-deoxy-phosphogluconate aldolase [Actinomycetales bacterium]MDP7306874.1 bifunctional 4-hydroxy-2-oxoglutarate aldolase/2-dehydro-3-deoxy-phosphogluconate aldolase [Roseibacillus sp.]HJM65120.1 bifunctional 4-hydroxy-2-oxoglutarate aldolase/2-dehydro-3-deoxy-phosphogluconate aldolase [Roseibacillus sp.]|tara:strand:- start:1639 stop:2274 length:636 start_codon:yes stop_codon:yes gene_type:complete